MKIHILDLRFQQLEHTIAAFAVEGPAGLVLVETGPHSTFQNLRNALSAKGLDIAGIRDVFLSHIHFDHAGAAWALAKQGAQIYVHPKGLPHLANPEKLYNSARMIYGENMEPLWGIMEAIPESQLTAPGHGDIVGAAGLNFRAWYTPGHAVHHIAWEVSEPATAPTEAALFTGDVGGVKINDQLVVPPCPPPDIQVEDWQNSIQLLRGLAAETLYLTHFGKITQKRPHLDALETRLLAWANWIRPYAEKQIPASEIVPVFQAFVRNELIDAGLKEADIQKYEAANPAFMSVAGLLRYWTKRQAG